MIGKIIQLVGGVASNDFEVVKGIEANQLNANRYLLTFCEIILGTNEPNITTTYIYGGHIVRNKEDNHKEILVFNGELHKEDKEEYLLVIIPFANQLVTNAKRIAGRYFYEAVLEMRNGDTVEVSKSLEGERTVYMAAQIGNEMFLIKKER